MSHSGATFILSHFTMPTKHTRTLLTIETFCKKSDTDAEEDHQVEYVLPVVLHKVFDSSHLGF